MTDPVVTYFAVYRSDNTTGTPREQEGMLICTALFQSLGEALEEAAVLLNDGYHVRIDRGSMLSSEYDRIEEVTDDFECSFYQEAR